MNAYGDVDYMRSVGKAVKGPLGRETDQTHKRAPIATAEFVFEGNGVPRGVTMAAEMLPSGRYFALRLTRDAAGRPALFLAPTVQMMARAKEEGTGRVTFQRVRDLGFADSAGNCSDADYSDSEGVSQDEAPGTPPDGGKRRKQRQVSSSSDEESENEVSDENDGEERGMSKRDRRLNRQRLSYARRQDERDDKDGAF